MSVILKAGSRMNFSKSKLSQYLRTRCDRSLYLSLHSERDLSEKGLPEALTSRPGVRHLRDSGIELEKECFRRLKRAFPELCVGDEKQDAGNWGNTPLQQALQLAPTAPSILIHPEYDLEADRELFLGNLGVSDENISVIPHLGSHIPDMIGVDIGRLTPENVPDYCVTPRGDRVIVAQDETRRRLTVVDVKHAQEANTSYESEVALYAIALANWLQARGLDGSYYVSSDMALWTNGGVANGTFLETATNDDSTMEERYAALRGELAPINAPIYLQAIRRFMAEQLPRVIITGDDNFENLEWHVCSRCGSCDWLGHRDWLSAGDRTRIDTNPNGYCFTKAAEHEHLSRVPMITRGARRVLENDGVETISALLEQTGNEDVFTKHTGLKSDRRNLPAYASAITTGDSSIDEERTDGGLARYSDLDVFISVNFDAGAGQLTGLGMEARFRQKTDYGQTSDVNRVWQEQWVVNGKSPASEGASVRAFLNYLAGVYEWVRDDNPQRGGALAARTSAQLIFWDQRQYEELCLAVGRHLPAILYGDEERTVKALIWLFPPEEIQERDALNARKPGVAFASDLVRRLIRTPALHEMTLFNIAEHYHWGDEFRVPDAFYREPLSDSIPRERIYEIWSASAAGPGYNVRWGTVVKDLSQLMDGFRRTLRTQVAGLRMVVWQLRQDFADRLKASAPQLDLTIPNWGAGVAYEAKLWLAWASFSKAYDDVMTQRSYLKDPEEIEARYEGIRLTELLEEMEDGSLLFSVSPESRDAKARVPESFIALSLDDTPGFLSQRVRQVIEDSELPNHLQDFRFLNRTMSTVFKVKLVEFDRENLLARFEWDNYFEDEQDLRSAIWNTLGDRANRNLTVTNVSGPNIQLKRLKRTLQAIGNPAIARPTTDTLTALGKMGVRVRAGTSPMTPAASVLWDASRLADEIVRLPVSAAEIADAAAQTSNPNLNPSQRNAIMNAVSKRLSIIWGPPGTGKTQTCAAMVHQLAIFEAQRQNDRAYNILLTGPNYKAVAELVERVARRMSVDLSTNASCFIIHREDREDEFNLPEETVEGFDLRLTMALQSNDNFQDMMTALNSNTGVNIVAAVVHQCPKIGEQAARLYGDEEVLRPLFDFILFDESSQADMTVSIPPLSLMRENAQLVLAGDLLQMPPISKCEPPVGAEYLVGSIQNYFVTRFGVRQEELLINYRSSDEIVQYIRSLGYPAGLEAYFPQASLDFELPVSDHANAAQQAGIVWSDGWEQVFDPEKRIVAITYEDGVSGQANPFEADCVVSLVHSLRATVRSQLANHGDQNTEGLHDDDTFWRVGIGIVTPHRAQRAIIVRKLVEAFPDVEIDLIESAVDTVERFQGGERHTIIVSFGVGDPDVIAGEERFLLQLERTNVAISRAMAKCIVLLSEDVAAHIPTDRDAIETAHALKGIVDEWCKHKTASTVTIGPENSRDIIIRTKPALDET